MPSGVCSAIFLNSLVNLPAEKIEKVINFEDGEKVTRKLNQIDHYVTLKQMLGWCLFLVNNFMLWDWYIVWD